jgi:serine/threonine protein kinase
MVALTVVNRILIAEVKVCDIIAQILLALHHCDHPYQGDWTLQHRDIKAENGKHTLLLSISSLFCLSDFNSVGSVLFLRCIPYSCNRESKLF